MTRAPCQAGMTLIELLLALAMGVVILATLASMVRAAGASNGATLAQLEVQGQARFAMRRIMQRVAQTPAASLPAKPDAASSGTWLSPAQYDLRAGTAAGTLALTETIGSTSHVLAEPVTAFSITSPATASGRTLVTVSLTVGDAGAGETVTETARLGGIP